MKLRLLLLPVLLIVAITFNQCALVAVGFGVGVGLKQVNKKAKSPSTDYSQIDTIYEERTIEEVEVVEEATITVEAEEKKQEIIIEQDEPTIDTTDVKDLPKSDTNKVDRSIFPVDVLGGNGVNNVDITQLKIFEEEFDMGTIVYGDSVKHTFRYQNIGAYDFVMTQYTVGCGCTEVSTPKKVLKPGEMGEITLQFNSKEKDGPGDYNSDAMILGNTPEGFFEFKIKVKVIEKE